ncbi:MAG: T9SS type A sorting domain-containing protein [Bacteroidetes bacterium]|nr:T9SS type A sorting domain-containing protein [Bacteroidota bacterium]
MEWLNSNFESATGPGCSSYTVQTDPETGEFTVEMPPMVYLIKDFDVPKNPAVAVYFSEFPEADFSIVNTEQTATHTFSGLVDAVVTIDTDNNTATMDIEGEDNIIHISDVEIINDGMTARFFYKDDVKQYPLDAESTVTVIETEVMGNNKTVSASYNYRYDLIYRTPPQIRVTAVDTVSPFTGEETVLYEDPVSKTMKEFNLKDNPLYYPVFVQGRDYSLMVFAEEVYLNQDVCDGINGCEEAAEDRVAVSDGVVNINNHLAIERNPAPLPLNNGRALYSFKGGEPNLLKDSNFPWRDYTNVLNISVNVDNVGYEWKPVETEADLGFSLPEGEPLREDDQYFRGYVLGTNVIEGNDFITNGPAVVDMILRDPPGSESYSFLEKGSSFSFEKSLSTSSTLTESYNTSIQLGAEFETGMGFITETEVEATTDIGFTATQTWNSDKTLTTEYTTTQSWQTSASPELAGAPSDLFLGSSKNFIVSLADNLTLLPDTFASRVGLPTAGRESAGMKIALNKSLVAAPSGESTHFIYTADHIENYLIPNLIAVRNNLFTNDAAYTSNIPISHELYGSNNDDARWGDQATTDDPVNTDTEKDYNGPSYTFIPPDSVTVMGKKVPKSKDMIRNYNQQIRLWREALERNEMEKYHAGLIKNISFDAGPTFEQSTETTVTQSHTTSFEASYNPEVALSVGGTVGGIGVFSTMGMSFNYSTGKTSTQTASQTNTFGYTLHDPDQGDYFSVDIKDAGTGTGPIFSIKGGRSMCPHEKTSPLKYYRPTEHIIGMGTLVELTGMNAAEDFRKILAWGENTGEYTFSEIKDVFDITDATKELIPDGAVFTIEQIYDRQFKNKLDLATAVEGLINLQLDLSLGENQEFGDDVAGNLEDMDQSDIREMSDQIEMDENNGFSRIYIFTSDQREQLLKEWARYRNYIYEITGSPLNDAEPTGNSTIRREVPKVSISPALRQNIPDDNLAYFTIQFGNDSYTDEGMTYIAQVLDNTNPDGAVIKMDGGTVNRSVTVGGGEQVNKTISVGMGKPDVYEYNNIQIVFYSPCEWEYSGNGSPLDPEAIDTVTFSVHFVPSCTNVEVVRPKNQFIINTDDEHMVNGVKETKVPILMSGYDLNNDIFEKLNFQFKSAANPDWIKTEDFYVVAENDELEIPGNFTAVEWDLSGYPDGEYNLRAKTYCGTTPDGSEIFDLSEVWTGVVDRKPPQVFGTPQPADGILSPDDDIIIEFNEEIYSDKLTKLENFDIRGILNGTDLRHDVSVAFDDNTADFVRIPEGINLVGKSFTIEFWMKTQRAYQNECIFSQNTDPENAIQIMLTGNGEVEFQVGDQTYSEDRVNTADIIDEWHHWTFVYDDVRGEAIVMMDGVPLGTGPLSPAYTGYGDAYLGKAMAGDRYPFKGNLHELRIWERPRTASSVTANMLVTLSGKETGLIGYWPFDDAYGNLAVEKVHRRNATINAPWDITPNGYAATFESNGQGMLDMDFSDVAFGEEENFTIEFWFKSGQGTNTCLLSNGYGDENDMALYYYSVYDLALTADVLPLEENVEQTLSPMINEIYSDQEVFLSDIGNLIGADKAEKYREQLLRFGKHMPTYWSINTDTYGNIQVNNNGKRIKTEGEDFFDNRWHHFALVVQRVGNTRLYIDGELKVSEPSTEWNGFGAARLFVGARGLFNQNNPGYEFDQYFNGSMDELRIWNTALKQSQIERNSTMRLDGDELGLVAYFPFESYEEVMGVPNIEGNTRDMMTPDSVRNVSSNTAVFTQNTNVPNVRMKRPSSKVDFSFVAQEERVAFVLNEPNAKIENCILDITVQNVEDMYGNKMNSPATWSAYVDMNQVKWNKQQIDVEKEIYEPLTFTAKVINSSGLQQNFSFENLPGWLTASPNAGTLDPLTEQEITFTVDEGTNVGQYSQNIHLQTDFDFDEKLMVNLRVTKPLPPDWEINPEEFEHSMNVIGMVTINNVISTDKYDKAAAFVDGKCRGIANLKYIPEYDMYEVFLDVYSNQVAGEYFELHIWDASEGRELRKVQADGLKEAPVQYDGLYEFVDNSIYGLPSSPINLEANNIIIQKIPMTAGWNWKSFNLTMNRNMPLGNQFEGLDSERGDMVKGLTKYSEYSSYWVGTLNYLEPEDMYMFKVSKNDTLKVSGVPVNPATTPVEIVEGWNWIGYTPQVNISINDALGKFTPNHGDLLKSQFSFAMYDELMGWVGTLTFLMPNEGYKYKYIPQGDAPLSQQLFYPEEGTVLKSAKLQGEDEEIPSIPSYSKFQDNMPLVAIIDMPTDKQNEQDELAVYSNSELRGISSPIRLEDGRLMYFVSVYGNQATDTLTLQFKNEKGEIFDVHETLHYKSSQILGTTSNPVILTVDTDNLLSIDETISYNIYPNPFNAQLQVDFSIPAEEKIEIEIIDIVGKPVSDKITLIGSDRKAVINTSVLKSGIYMVKLSIEGSVFYERIIKE